MNISQILFEALESLNGNKMRSGLTILGIVIGVAAVIAMLAVGNGAQDSILGSINDIGTNLLFVFEGNDDADVRIRRQISEMRDLRRGTSGRTMPQIPSAMPKPLKPVFIAAP